jgi:hypothetical protein
MRLMRMVRSVMIAGCAALAAACSESPTGIVGEHMEMVRARRLWNAQDVDDYRMTVRLTGAWFSGSAVITVRDGVPVSVEPDGYQGPMEGGLWSHYDTVEELFGIVEYAVEEKADRLNATFHDRLGVPVEVDIDYREGWADDEHGFIVETFDRL